MAALTTAVLLWPARAGATFSIVARDPATGDIGIAVASRVLAVRLAVAVVDAEVGVVARQADVILKHGPRAMDLLKQGLAPEQVIAELLKEGLASTHQIGIIDVQGRVAASTGAGATDWKGHKTGPNYSVQGNVLVGPQVVDAMAAAFEKTTGPLHERLFAALKAGDDAGGDRRGRQSAFLQVVRKGAAVYGQPMVNIAVDDSPEPLKELRRLLDVQTAWNLQLEYGPLFMAGKYGEARAVAKRGVDLNPTNQPALLSLGIFTYMDGDRAEALSLLRRARQLNETTFKVWWELFRASPPAKKLFEDKDFERQLFQ